MNIILFGTGDCYLKYKKWFEQFHIVALLDNDRNKQGTQIDGHSVLSPVEGVEENYDYIFILSVHEAEIRKELRGLGVEDTKILHYHELRTFLAEKAAIKRMPVQFYPYEDETRTVLMLSYDLNASGAFLAFFEAAVILKKNGYRVVVASMDNGPMRKKLMDSGIAVIIDPNMQIGTCSDIDWMKIYDVVFCNTLNFYHMLSKREESQKYVWWLHEPETFYEGIDAEELRQLSDKNLHIYAAGRVAAEAFKKFHPDAKVSLLRYGIPDAYMYSEKPARREEDKKRFAVVGNVQNYKGQDILIDAIKLLDEKARQESEFFIYGNRVSKYAEDLMLEAKDLSCVHFEGAITHEELLEKLRDIDVLICPSREDTMPVAVTEAMMLNIPCIVSDAVGTAEYITNDRDGMIVKSDDRNALAKAICRCISDDVDLKSMGTAARNLYDNYFSMNVFEKTLLEMAADWINPTKTITEYEGVY